LNGFAGQLSAVIHAVSYAALKISGAPTRLSLAG
jgi:hypothetical protein